MTPLRPLERAAVWIDVALGVLLVAVAGYLLVVSLGDRMESTSAYGGVYGLLGAVLLGPPGVLFLLGAVGMARRWRGRWWLHALPLLWPVALFAFGTAGGLLR